MRGTRHNGRMKILVLGAGGTGGYFGGCLAAVHPDVTFLVRPKRAAQLAADGLIIETPNERVVLRVSTVSAENVTPDYDLILLSCKAYDLQSSIEAIRPAMHAQTVVIPLLNGISHLDTLDAAFGSARVMGGSCQIAATLTADGVVKSLSDLQNIVWGARGDNPYQHQLAAGLATLFAKTTVSWRVSDKIMLDMWEKLTFLCTLAGMTSLMRASIGAILATNDGAALMRRYIDSCIAIATAEGFAPREPMRARFETVLNSVGSPMTASMLRDIEAGNQVEADHIVGYMLGKARQHAIDDTLLSVAYTHLQAYQGRRAAAL
jgi:2-dehydropantoate 2-reductase